MRAYWKWRAKKQAEEKQHTVGKQEKSASDEEIAEGKKPESKINPQQTIKITTETGILVFMKKWKTREPTIENGKTGKKKVLKKMGEMPSIYNGVIT